jgi:tetratricopeptide (TPR) repeat protein
MADSPRIDELRRRVQSDPASIAFAALAEEYRRAGRFEEAIDTCTAGLVRHPSYLSAHVTLGRALIDVGRLEEARGPLQYVLKLAPENLAAIRGLAEIHDRLGADGSEHRDESPVEEPAAPTMTVEEIHAASGFIRPESEATPAQVNVADPIEVEPAMELRPTAPEPPATPSADEEPAAAEMPVVAAPVVDVEPPRIDPPALAELEGFLNAILRARAERVSIR